MNINDIPEPIQDDNRHPSLNQIFVKEAIRALTPKQKQVWEYLTYEKMTQDAIAHKLGLSQSVVCRHIKAAKKKMARWFKEHEGMYDLLKEHTGC